MAIFGGQASVIGYVLETPELECLINQPDVNGNTPLYLATIERKTWILCYLKWDGRVNQSSKNKCGQTAFDIDRSFKESGMKSPRKLQHIMPNFGDISVPRILRWATSRFPQELNKKKLMQCKLTCKWVRPF